MRLAQAPAELAQLVRHLCARITGSDDTELASEVTASVERNVRELEQCLRRVQLTGACARDERRALAQDQALAHAGGALTAAQLLQRDRAALYARHESFVEVARITGLDRRTVKKYVETQQAH